MKANSILGCAIVGMTSRLSIEMTHHIPVFTSSRNTSSSLLGLHLGTVWGPQFKKNTEKTGVSLADTSKLVEAD